MVNMKEKQVAPDRLEHVRDFLNTWRIPNATRLKTDLFDSQEAVQHFQEAHFPAVERTGEVELIRQLRDDLRGTLGKENIADVLNSWFERFPIQVALKSEDGKTVLQYRPARHEAGLCGVILALVVEAVAQDNWRRLKPCLDCQWVFFDHTKNASKVWCGMLAYSPEGRACGSIAKVRRWRERQKQKSAE
jgi:predicted RNA-binding Zn ribbon-like protein